MKNYDFEFAKKIIQTFTSLVEVESVSLGMQEDWFWTVEKIWENGEYIKELNEETEIKGINGSHWATPVIQINLENGEQHILNCFKSTGESNIRALLPNA